MKELRIQKEKEQKKREKEQEEQKYIAKCTKQCPKLQSVLGTTTTQFIRTNMDKIYRKAYEIKMILNCEVLERFMANKCASDGSEWKFVFHGTESKNNEGIIKNGLIIGGTKGVRVRNGSVHGRGIYCSPNSATARGYEKGSMFVCVVRDGEIKKCGSIWVVQKECDILPLYFVSIGGNVEGIKPKWPYFPVSAALQSVLMQKTNNLAVADDDDDGLSQRVLKFVPSFSLLNV